MFLKTLILKLVDKWYKPFIFSVISSLLLCFFSLNNNLDFFIGKDNIGNCLIFLLLLILIGVLGVFISGVISFYRKQILRGIILTTTSIFLCIFYLFLFIFLGYAKGTSDGYNRDLIRENYSYDHFADSLTIPKKVNINTPLNVEFIDIDNVKNREKLKLKKTSTFYLLSLGGLGMYEYDIYVNKIDKGEVYLKAFEITKGTKLSEESLKKESTIKIFNPNNRLKRFGTVNNFLINEGDEGKPYAARFEVWYKPYLGKEKKLYSKNYIIEGYQPD